MLPIAFLTYCPWPFEHTAHDLSRIRQQETFVVDQSFGVGGTGARCGGAPQVPFTQVKNITTGFTLTNLFVTLLDEGGQKILARGFCVAWCWGGGHVKWCHEVAKPSS